MTEEDLNKLMEFGEYRGAIERTRISKVHSVESGEDGSLVYIVGRHHANAIVRALKDAGYSIVRTDQ
jgi:hypothetical protein